MGKSLEPVTILASDLCEDIGDSTERHHLRFQKKLMEGYRELHLYISPELDVKSEVFPVATGQIELPCDFVYETKIGLLKDNILVTLDLKKELRMNNYRNTDSQIQNDLNSYFDGSLTPANGYPFFNVFKGGNYLGEMYGFGSGYHSNTWYNITDGVLQLSSIVPDDTEVVIEYKSNGLQDGFKLVPTEMVAALKYYAKWQFYADTKPTLAATNREEYKMQYQRLKRMYNQRTPDYLAWLFKSTDRPAHV